MTDALLTDYQAIEALSAHMLQAAEQADWPAFEQASQACTRQVEALRERRLGRAGSPADCAVQAAQKHALLLKILRHDAQIRRLRAGGVGTGGAAQHGAAQQADPGFHAYPVQATGGLLH